MRECQRSPRRRRRSRAAARKPRTVPSSSQPTSAMQMPTQRAETPQRSPCDGRFRQESRLAAVSHGQRQEGAAKHPVKTAPSLKLRRIRGDPDGIRLRNINERQTKTAEHVGPLEVGFAALLQGQRQRRRENHVVSRGNSLRLTPKVACTPMPWTGPRSCRKIVTLSKNCSIYQRVKYCAEVDRAVLAAESTHACAGCETAAGIVELLAAGPA